MTDNNDKVKCPVCKKEFKNLGGMRSHEAQVHGKANSERREEKREVENVRGTGYNRKGGDE